MAAPLLRAACGVPAPARECHVPGPGAGAVKHYP